MPDTAYSFTTLAGVGAIGSPVFPRPDRARESATLHRTHPCFRKIRGRSVPALETPDYREATSI